MASALSNYANMLVNQRLEGAEQLLRRALDNVPAGTLAYAQADTWAELGRQGRHPEAVEWATRAAAIFREHDEHRELFITLRNLAGHFVDARRFDEAARAFEEAHDLILEQRHEQLDEYMTRRIRRGPGPLRR